jgi:FAD synthase
MGTPEDSGHVISSELPQLLKVPITEECKILPSPGIYAVSVESKSLYSKGMAVINRDSGEKAEVLVNIFDDNKLFQSSKVSILFHKKIHGAVNLSETKSLHKIAAAKDEISDLIY